MKFLKILVVIVVLVAIGLIAFLPSEMKIKKETTIDAPADVVYEQISDYHNWMKWSAWHQLDSNMKVEYSEKRSGVGAFQKWESEHPELGIGKMETVEAKENEYMLQDLYFFDLENPAFQTWFKLDSDGENKTKVTWAQADSAETFDIGKRMMFAFVAAKVEQDFVTGLENLKNEAEYQFANAKPYKLKISEKELPVEYVMAALDSCGMDAGEMRVSMENCYSNLAMAFKKNKVASDYTAYTIAQEWDEENGKFVFQAGYKVEDQNAKAEENMSVVKVGGSNYVVGMFEGESEHLYTAHQEIDSYMNQKGIKAAGMPFEKYMFNENDEAVIMIAYPIN